MSELSSDLVNYSLLKIYFPYIIIGILLIVLLFVLLIFYNTLVIKINISFLNKGEFWQINNDPRTPKVKNVTSEKTDNIIKTVVGIICFFVFGILLFVKLNS